MKQFQSEHVGDVTSSNISFLGERCWFPHDPNVSSDIVGEDIRYSTLCNKVKTTANMDLHGKSFDPDVLVLKCLGPPKKSLVILPWMRKVEAESKSSGDRGEKEEALEEYICLS